MENRIKVSVTDPIVKRILQATYPAYRGRKIFIVAQKYPLNCKSYWDGGSRDYFTFLKLDTFQVAQMPAQSAFDKDIKGADAVTLPPGIVCVKHSIFCGKDVGCEIIANPENLTSLLPAPMMTAHVPTVLEQKLIGTPITYEKEHGYASLLCSLFLVASMTALFCYGLPLVHRLAGGL